MIWQLRATRVRSPFDATWTLTADGRRVLETRVRIDPDAPRQQALIDRERSASGARRPALQAELADTLRDVLGAELSDELGRSRVDELHVLAPRVLQPALTLPYELLFDPTATVVVRHVTRLADESGAPPPASGLLAAFALCPGDAYLSLHAEARGVRGAAAAAGIPVEELFVTFTADDLLAAGRGKAIVHVAGHGSGGVFRCIGADGSPCGLTARQMIEAWRSAPPQLVVLNFCDSSDERDVERVLVMARNHGLQADEHVERMLGPADDATTSSMALDLAAALPTTVIAMRTSVADGSAQRFALELYREHLGGARSITAAFRAALAATSAVDNAGVPVPTLYAGALPPAPDGDRSPGVVTPEPRGVTHARKLANMTHGALAPLAATLDQSWICMACGEDDGAFAAVEQHVAGVWGARHPDVPLARIPPVASHVRMLAGPPASDDAHLVMVFLDSAPEDVPFGEVVALQPTLDAADAELIARATCQVPSLVAALDELPLEATAARLRARAQGRSVLSDRALLRDLAQLLIEAMPSAVRDRVDAWSERKWERLAALGPFAIDVVATRLLLQQPSRLEDESYQVLSRLARASGGDFSDLLDQLARLDEAGVAHASIPSPGARRPELFVVDQLTVARAWAACSPHAREAAVAQYLESRTAFLASREAISTVSDEAIAQLAQMCIDIADVRAWQLIELLVRRGAPGALVERLAADARARDVPALDAQMRQRDAAWNALRRDMEAGRSQDVTAALGGLEPASLAERLQIRAIELAAGVDLPPHDTLARAEALEREVRAMDDLDLPRRPRLVLLHTLRQAKAAAHRRRGDRAAALAVLSEQLADVVALGGDVTQHVLAQAPVAEHLHEEGRLEEARAVVAPLRALVEDLPPSAARCWVLTLDLRLLGHEQREARMDVVVKDLAATLRDWHEPRRDLAEEALIALALAAGARGRVAEGIAWYGIADLTSRDRARAPGRAATNAALLLSGDPVVTARDVQRALGELSGVAEPLLQRLGIEVRDLGASVAAWFPTVPRLSEWDLLEKLIGPERIERLRGRAGAGCAIAPLALRSLQPVPSGPLALPNGWAASELRAFAAAEEALAEILKPALREKLVLGLPWLARAHAGDLEARAVMFGLLAGDHQVGLHRQGGHAEIHMRLARGEGWEAVAPLVRDLRGADLVEAVVAVEVCLRAAAGEDPGPAVPAGSAWAQRGWALQIDQADHDEKTAAGLLDMLLSVFGGAGEVAAVCGGASRLPEQGGELLRSIATRLQQSFATRTAVGRQLLLAGHEAYGARILRETIRDGDVSGAVAASCALLAHLVDVRAVGEATAELQRLVDAAAQLPAPSREWTDAMGAASRAAFALGELALATSINAALANAYPRRDATLSPHDRSVVEQGILSGSFNVLALLIADGDFGAAAKWLTTLSARFDLPFVSWMLAPQVEVIPGEHVAKMCDAVLTASPTGVGAPDDSRPFSAEAREMVTRLLDTIAGKAEWSRLDTALRQRLR